MAQHDEFLDTPLGTFDTTPGSTPVADGYYAGNIKAITPRCVRGGQPELDENGKRRVTIEVDLEDGTALQRTTSIAFGKNSKKNQYSQWAQFIEAATGVRCGDPAQRQYTARELISLPIGVRTKFSGSWTDIEEFVPVDRVKARVPLQTARTQPQRAQGANPPTRTPVSTPPQAQGAAKDTRSNQDAPSPPGQARIMKLAADSGITEAELLAMANKVNANKPFTEFSAPECARVSMLIGRRDLPKPA